MPLAALPPDALSDGTIRLRPFTEQDWRLDQALSRDDAVLRDSLAALTRRSRRDIVEVWLTAAEIVAEAGRIVRDAGADPDSDVDGKARGRLLASTNHSLTFDILGAFLPAEVEQQAADDLAEDLRRIDDE